MVRIPAPAKVPGPDAGSPVSGPGAAADLTWLTTVPISALTAVVVLAVVAPAVAQQASLPVAIAGLMIGVPHGAVDHLVPRWADVITSRMATGWLVVAYVSGAVLAAGALLAAPAAAVLAFLLLSAAHFGTAESAFGTERLGQTTARPWARPCASITHGAVVIGLLLWAHPEQVQPWLQRLSSETAHAAMLLRVPGLLLIGTLVLGQVASGLMRAAALPLAELSVLVAAFTVAPPLLALGVYFGCWHALRHTGRLLDLARQPDDPNWRIPARRLLIGSLLPSAVALGTMAGLVIVGNRAPIVLEVSVLLALTFPHSALVWFVDAKNPPSATRPRAAS